jgi:hypothetical protein
MVQSDILLVGHDSLASVNLLHITPRSDTHTYIHVPDIEPVSQVDPTKTTEDCWELHFSVPIPPRKQRGVDRPVRLYLAAGRTVGDLAVVERIGDKINCTVCRRPCSHSKRVKGVGSSEFDASEFEQQQQEESLHGSKEWVLEEGEVKVPQGCRYNKSNGPIPEEPDDALSKKMQKLYAGWTAAHNSGTVYVFGGDCEERTQAWLFTSKFVLEVSIPTTGYDSYDDCVLNVKDKYLFPWEILYGYWLDPHVSYKAYWRGIVWKAHATMFLRGPALDLALNRRRDFMHACIAFGILQECPHADVFCKCEVKDLVVADGNPTAVRSKWMNLIHWWRQDKDAPHRDARDKRSIMFLAGCTHSEFWNLSRKFSDKTALDRKKNKQTRAGGLSPESYKFFCELAGTGQKDSVTAVAAAKKKRKVRRSSQQPPPQVQQQPAPDARILALVPLLNLTTTTAGIVRPQEHVREMLDTLVSPYPVARVLPPQSWESFDRVLATVGVECPSAEDVSSLAHTSPIVFELITGLSDDCRTMISPEFRDLFVLISTRAKAAFEKDGVQYSDDEKEDDEPPLAGYMECEAEYFYTGYGGTDSVLGSRVPFPTFEEDKGASSAAVCNKEIKKPGFSGPGMLRCFCLKCGRDICYQLMKWSEGPRVLHELLYLRWKTAPDVVYDNVRNNSFHPSFLPSPVE